MLHFAPVGVELKWQSQIHGARQESGETVYSLLAGCARWPTINILHGGQKNGWKLCATSLPKVFPPLLSRLPWVGWWMCCRDQQESLRSETMNSIGQVNFEMYFPSLSQEEQRKLQQKDADLTRLLLVRNVSHFHLHFPRVLALVANLMGSAWLSGSW